MVTAAMGMKASDVAKPAGGSLSPSMLVTLSVRHDLPPPLEDYLETGDGTRLRYAHWPAAREKRRGSILYLNGRTEFIEKTMAAYAILHRSGLDVWTLDWRGQGLSTRALADPDKGHVTDYQDYLDDLHQFLTEVTDLPARHGKTLLLAQSMGGHIGLRYLHDHPGPFDAAVLSAPMIDIPVNRAPMRWLNTAIVNRGLGESYTLTTGRFRPVFQNPNDPGDNGRIEDYRQLSSKFKALSFDAEKRMEIERLIRENSGLALGGPTSAWLNATFRSIRLTWSPGYAEVIETPVLMIGGGCDPVVIAKRQEEMTNRLPGGRFHLIDQAAHELLTECDDVRFAFFEQVAEFTGVDIDQPPINMQGCVRG